MDFEKLSDRLKGFIQSAQTLAVREGNPQITPEHLLKVLLDDPEGLASGLISRDGGDPKQALEKTEAALAKLPKVSGSGATQPHMAVVLARVIDQAEQMATKAGDSLSLIHISEPTRLRRISYAVFCLKKKKKTKQKHQNHPQYY